MYYMNSTLVILHTREPPLPKKEKKMTQTKHKLNTKKWITGHDKMCSDYLGIHSV